MFNIPILFVFFNRKDIAMQSFERIKAIRPSTLYLAQDGARQDRGMEEKEVIKELRQSIIVMCILDSLSTISVAQTV